jgi:hypothetical protein
MKKAIGILIAVTVSLTAGYSQSPILKVNSLNDLIKIVEDIPQITKNKYVVYRADTTAYGNSELRFHLNGDYGKNFTLTFNQFVEGGNNKRVYSFSTAGGLFLDIFPFWQKYFEPGADMKSIQEKGISILTIKDNTGDEDRIVFKKSSSGKEWEITIRS